MDLLPSTTRSFDYQTGRSVIRRLRRFSFVLLKTADETAHQSLSSPCSVLSANLGCRSTFWSRRRRGRLWEDGPSSEFAWFCSNLDSVKDSVLPITPQNTSRHPSVCVPMGKRLKEWLHIQLLPHWNCIATNYTRAWSITISIWDPVSSQRTTLGISKWAIEVDNDERSFHLKSP